MQQHNYFGVEKHSSGDLETHSHLVGTYEKENELKARKKKFFPAAQFEGK